MNQETVNIISSIAIPIITFIIGFFVSRFTMTKKESADHKNRLQDNSNKLSSDVSDAFERFTQALATYNSNSTPTTADDFFAISTKGELYFEALKRLADSILSGNVDKQSVENSHIPDIKEAVERTLPDFYDTMKTIATKLEINYSGTLRKEQYKSIYLVYEKYVITG